MIIGQAYSGDDVPIQSRRVVDFLSVACVIDVKVSFCNKKMDKLWIDQHAVLDLISFKAYNVLLDGDQTPFYVYVLRTNNEIRWHACMLWWNR